MSDNIMGTPKAAAEKPQPYDQVSDAAYDAMLDAVLDKDGNYHRSSDDMVTSIFTTIHAEPEKFVPEIARFRAEVARLASIVRGMREEAEHAGFNPEDPAAAFFSLKYDRDAARAELATATERVAENVKTIDQFDAELCAKNRALSDARISLARYSEEMQRLRDRLFGTVTTQYHDEIVGAANKIIHKQEDQIASLRVELEKAKQELHKHYTTESEKNVIKAERDKALTELATERLKLTIHAKHNTLCADHRDKQDGCAACERDQALANLANNERVRKEIQHSFDLELHNLEVDNTALRADLAAMTERAEKAERRVEELGEPIPHAVGALDERDAARAEIDRIHDALGVPTQHVGDPDVDAVGAIARLFDQRNAARAEADKLAGLVSEAISTLEYRRPQHCDGSPDPVVERLRAALAERGDGHGK